MMPVSLNNRKIYMFLLVCVFSMMLLRINSSPLFDTSIGDSAVFVTMGRAMKSGKILYKELFDHKGWYLYLINFLAAIISKESLIGLFLVEVIFMFMSSLLVFKICSEFQDKNVALLSSLLMIVCMLNPFTMGGGNLTEEYTLPFQFLAIYLAIVYMKSGNYQHKPAIMFVHGLIVGIVMNLRANHVLMWLPIALIVAYRLVIARDFRCLVRNILSGIAGLFVGILPVIIYAWVNNALYDVLFGTFIYNFTYISNNTVSLRGIVLNIIKQIPLCVAIFVSCIVIVRSKIISSTERVFYFSMLFASIVAISISGRAYGHYYMYVIPFVIPALCWLSKLLLQKISLKTAILCLSVFAVLFAGSICLRRYYVIRTSTRNYNLGIDIEDDKNVIVLENVCEFYVYNGIIPQEKYFYIPGSFYKTFSLPIDSQIASVINGKNDVLITRRRNLVISPYNLYAESENFNALINTLENEYAMIRSVDIFRASEADIFEVYERK